MSTAQFKCFTHFSGVTLVVGTWGAFEFLGDLWKGTPISLSIFVVGEKILRLPHADGFAQFHDTSFLMILKGWFVVAVPIVRCCGVVSMATASTRGRPRVGLSGRSWKTHLAQHPNDKMGSFDVVRFDLKMCVLCPASIRA